MTCVQVVLPDGYCALLASRFRRRIWPTTTFPPTRDMRAAVYDRGCPEGIRVVTNRALPAPSRNALLVRVKACGVNPVDAKGVIGDKLPPFLRGFARRLVDGKTAGFDLSGVVEQAPPGCGFAVGDEVYGAVPPFRGALAELVSVPLDQVARKPESLTHEQAAALVLPGVTVAQLLDQHGFAPGQHVLVLGAKPSIAPAPTPAPTPAQCGDLFRCCDTPDLACACNGVSSAGNPFVRRACLFSCNWFRPKYVNHARVASLPARVCAIISPR